ncbi:PREDICTED: stress response protein NST1 [Nelumbo nucifera]|uniref:Stress response protein NST1 n=1 Tax=Nelumbo nucifera TaxID=4432 RepID=A0A1U7ZPE6_NELNU|nr:PREDICTED: stress response protein NST1 [Nelumbo nucifera]XP_010255236.2 PREDICTED: stress response protein NST1 [Nelumbo nucifera]
MACAQVPTVVSNEKKKQSKYELDRLKQAEKKKRRLEKALATSAAIRAELEKKKQNQKEEEQKPDDGGAKKEEQQRLDGGGAAIAEESLVDNMAYAQVPTVVSKEKKKQAKYELDRLKQAEKKKRRLEKALATSAAIRSELEKKKQKKKEEQQRLDEEGAAIAEAVALHVLAEDTDDSCEIGLKRDEAFNPWGHKTNNGLFKEGWRTGLPHQGFMKPSLEGLGWMPDACGSGFKWNDWGMSGWSLSPGVFGRDLHSPYIDEKGRARSMTETSAGLIAAQAVSSLQIAEDAHADAIVINGMLGGKLKKF